MSENYFTGADVTAYMSSGLEQPNFNTAAELDVDQVTVQQDGRVRPLYDFTDDLADAFEYTRSMVNLNLSFNYSEPFVRRFRQPFLQMIRDKSLWLVMQHFQDRPQPAIVRDKVRVSSVYEHPTKHTPAPTVKEEVPCTARDLTLVEREQNVFDGERISRFVESGEQAALQGPDAFKKRQSEFLGKVKRVIDGDTYEVELESTKELIDVRLIGADTPETSATRNQENDSSYAWPNTSAAQSSPRGTAGSPPDAQQLADWANLATDRVTEHIEGEPVWLVTDPSAASTDDPSFNPLRADTDQARFLFRVRPITPIPNETDTGGERDLSRWLIKNGYADTFDGSSVSQTGGRYANRYQRLKDLHRRERDKAGTSSANGLWYSFDIADWKSAAGI